MKLPTMLAAWHQCCTLLAAWYKCYTLLAAGRQCCMLHGVKCKIPYSTNTFLWKCQNCCGRNMPLRSLAQGKILECLCNWPEDELQTKLDRFWKNSNSDFKTGGKCLFCRRGRWKLRRLDFNRRGPGFRIQSMDWRTTTSSGNRRRKSGRGLPRWSGFLKPN